MSEKTELPETDQQQPERKLNEIELDLMTPTKRKRYKARLRKRKQRAHERKGIPSGIENRLTAEWTHNLAAAEADPDQSEALRDRLLAFNHIRDQMRTVMDRIRRGVHAEASGDGQFYDCIATDVLAHADKYGLAEFFPPFLLLMTNAGSTEPIRQNAIDALKSDANFFYRLTYGLNIDSLSNLEYDAFFQYFFDWYLTNRDNAQYDFDWEIADSIYSSFVIPLKFLEGVFGTSTKSIWIRLHRRRTGTLIEPSRF